MNEKHYLVWLLLAASVCTWAADSGLRIYLPNEKTVETNTPQLGQVALVLGDTALVQTAEKVGLGQFAATGQQLIVDRQTVLSCLASAGIDGRRVQFNGAESTCVKRLEATIAADRFMETAQTFLLQQLAEQQASLKLLRPTEDFVLAGASSGIELKPRLSGAPSRGMQRVTVGVMQGDKEIGSEDVLFAVQYERKRVISGRRLETGTEVSLANTRIETYTSNQPQEGGVFLPYGMITTKVINAGSTIEETDVEAKTAPVVIKRQQQVVLKIDTDLLLISAFGEAMEDGKIGDVIRVRRGSRLTNDERYVVGRVMQDGTVQPLVN